MTSGGNNAPRKVLPPMPLTDVQIRNTKQPEKRGEFTYMVPGPGERVFGGTQDHEMSFAIPVGRIENLITGLE